jgi:hypothetical protein
MTSMSARQPNSQSPVSERAPERQSEADIGVHIFSVSAALVGVCLTVSGIVRVVIGPYNRHSLVDDFLAADAVLFLISCLLSSWALRARSLRRMYRVERAAGVIFLLGLSLMVLACSFITYAILW